MRVARRQQETDTQTEIEKRSCPKINDKTFQGNKTWQNVPGWQNVDDKTWQNVPGVQNVPQQATSSQHKNKSYTNKFTYFQCLLPRLPGWGCRDLLPNNRTPVKQKKHTKKKHQNWRRVQTKHHQNSSRADFTVRLSMLKNEHCIQQLVVQYCRI